MSGGAPERIEAALRRICAELGLAASDAQIAALGSYLALLQRWNAVYNLTAVRDPAHMLVQHLADCLAVVAPLRRHLDGADARLLDVGSGAGLPGVVLASMLPSLQVVCVDAVGKKVAFIRQAVSGLRLENVLPVHGRVERLNLPAFDVVTSRAFSSLGDLVRVAGRLLQPAGVFMAMKGKPAEAELETLPSGYRVFHVEPLSVPGLNAERCLVWIERDASHEASQPGAADA